MSIVEILERETESSELDFKREFVELTPGAWPEFIKDVIAIANTGGGAIVCGLNDDGQPSGLPCADLLAQDHAQITDKIKKYVGKSFGDFKVSKAEKLGNELALFLVGATELPMVFVQPGTYQNGDRQVTAFARGSLYFRHGAKSEPAEQGDIGLAFERLYDLRRESLYANIRKVIEAPPNSVFIPIQSVDNSDSLAVRITDDPGAQPVSIGNPDVTHPYRLKELLKELNFRLPNERITQHHIRNIRKYFKDDANPRYHFQSKHSAHQYSVAFVDLLLGEHAKNSDFFKVMHDLHRTQV